MEWISGSGNPLIFLEYTLLGASLLLAAVLFLKSPGLPDSGYDYRPGRNSHRASSCSAVTLDSCGIDCPECEQISCVSQEILQDEQIYLL